MNLFDVLVRLDIAGWKSFPPREPVEPQGCAEVTRLLRKASALQRGEERYDFTGIEAEAPPFTSDAPPICISTEAMRSVWVVPTGSGVVIASSADGLVVLATSISGFLEHLLEPRAVSETPAQPLGNLGFDGEGWGWQLLELSTPTRLVELPSDEPLNISMDCIWAGHRVREVLVPSDSLQEAAVQGPDLGELFGEGVGRARPRTGLVVGLLLAGVIGTILGMACIAAPGGLLVLLAWFVVEKDHDRVESGYLPEADRAVVERSRNLTHAGLLLVVCLFFLQAMLLCFGGYDALLDDVYIPFWRGLVGGVLGQPDTDLPL